MSTLLASGTGEGQPDEHAITWNPDAPGDAVIGRVEALRREEKRSGEYDVAYLRTRRGTLRRIFFTWTMLCRKWNEEEPHYGDRVAIMYDGQAEGGEGSMYKVFDLEIERHEGGEHTRPVREPDFDDLSAPF